MCEKVKCYHKDAHHPITHCIFDMDGLLLDTEVVNTRVINEILQEYGHSYSTDLKEKVMGRTTADAWATIQTELKLEASCETLVEDFLNRTYEPIGMCPLMPGVEKLLTHLNKHEIPLAVATSSSESAYNHKSSQHNELFSIFHHIVCGEGDPEVKQSKPHPDIFLVCARRFPDDPNPSNCLVFEDAANGVSAAINAGMQCVVIPNALMPKELFSDATLILNSLEEFEPERFGLPPFKRNCKKF